MGPTGQRFTVLIADDSAIQRKLVENALFGEAYSLLFATTGQEALDLFAENRPELLITDWMMPDFSGIELCQLIRAQFQDSYTYIIILTSHSDKENVVKGLAAGADDYLTKPFYPEELQARLAVGRRIIELHRQNQAKAHQLEEAALTDALTGLPNRRAVEDWATRQLSSAARHGFRLWVVMADLDNFKKVNDTYGHEAGDAVLKKFAEILMDNTRRSDMSARIGGEEFLLVLTHGDTRGVQAAIERVRAQFEAHSFTFGGRRVKVTASFGIAGFQGNHAPDFNRLLTQADVALYGAKRGGRNLVEMAVTEVH
jgi:two-component system cell cycle response regulator